MNLKIKKLRIFSKNGEEAVYDFADSLTFIYGNIGAGKTTLLNLIMYCLGREIVKTPAVNTCLEAVQMEVVLQGHLCRFYRKADSKRILVEDLHAEQSFRLVNSEVSDYLFRQCELPFIYQASGLMSDQKVKLTFTNFSWFCYLKQSEMDSNFFQLDSDNIFRQNAAENTLLTLLNSDVLIDRSLNEQYRTVRRRHRQYEEGREIFKYLDRELMGDGVLSLTEKKMKIQNLTDEIHKMRENKQFFTCEEMEQLLTAQNQLDRLKYQYIYERKKTGYYKALDTVRSEKAELEEQLKRDASADSIHVSHICDLFLECLREVGFQGISKYDNVIMESRNHYAPILYNRYDQQRISFQNLGSGGKKTIFKICFALALYRFYGNNGEKCYLPDFLIIDTPMKNISEREDEEMYIRFYRYLFQLFSTELKDKQLIIVDKEEKDLSDYAMRDEAILMKMTRDDPLNPPLFREYKGL